MTIALPFACPLELHARYGSLDISAALGLATLDRSGQTGVGRNQSMVKTMGERAPDYFLADQIVALVDVRYHSACYSPASASS